MKISSGRVKNRKLLYPALFLLILTLQILLTVYYGTQKAGFHEDEYFSYYTTARTNGFYYDDRTWTDTSELKKEFMILDGEGFRFDRIRTVASWDVHPPLFYDFLDVAMSLTPGVFSKWQGICVNLAAFVLIQCLAAAAALEISGSPVFSLFAAAAVGACPASVTMVMLVRMYAWLAAFILLSVLFHLKLLKAEGGRPEKTALAGCAAATIFGFLTQYFFILYLACAGLFYLLFLVFRYRKKDVKKQGIRRFLYYCLSQAGALFLTVLYYPWSLSHIFRGYRGNDAVGSFLSLSGLVKRPLYFFSLLDRYGFNGFLPLLLLPAAAVLIRMARQKKADAAWLFLLTAAAGYFLFASRSGLVLGEASIRYVLPTLPLLILLIADSLRRVFQYLSEGNSSAVSGRQRIFAAAAILLTGCIYLSGFLNGSVLFLYREDAEKTAYAAQTAELPVVVSYHPSTPYNIWRLTDELFEHRKLYYMDPGDLEPIDDPVLTGADDLLLYLADHENDARVLELFTGNKMTGGGFSAEPVFDEDMWHLYRLTR